MVASLDPNPYWCSYKIFLLSINAIILWTVIFSKYRRKADNMADDILIDPFLKVLKILINYFSLLCITPVSADLFTI